MTTATRGPTTDQAIQTTISIRTRSATSCSLEPQVRQEEMLRNGVVPGVTTDLPSISSDFRTRGTIDPMQPLQLNPTCLFAAVTDIQPSAVVKYSELESAIRYCLAALTSQLDEASHNVSFKNWLLNQCDDYRLWLRLATAFSVDSGELTVPARFVLEPKRLEEEEYAGSRFEDVDQARKFLKSSTL